MRLPRVQLWVGALLLGLAACASGADNTCTNSGYWDSPGIWNAGHAPLAGEVVSVPVGRSVTITNGTAWMAAFTNAGSITFDAWDAPLRATTMQLGGTVTHTVNTDTTGTIGVYPGDWMPDKRVFVEGGDVVVSGAINADYKGYKGGAAPCGPGATATASPRPGAGHGGRGASPTAYSAGGITYGSATAPTDPGSGGGNSYQATLGNGGGVVRISATGRVTVTGTISANGQGAGNSWGGRGSGGSVHISCDTFAGNGTVRADGGEHNGEEHAGGGGGRVAVVYSPASQAAVTPKPSATLSAKGGRGRYFTRLYLGDPGTVHVSDTSFFPPAVASSGFVPVLSGLTTWKPSAFTVNDTWVKFPDGFTLAPTNTLTVNGSVGRLDLSSNAVIQCGNLVVTNYAHLYVTAAATNGAAPGYGARIDVSGGTFVHGNAILYLTSEPRNGGSVFLRLGDLSVLSGGLIDADGRGFRGADAANLYGYGPGRATTSTSPSRPASYGGLGGGAGAGLTYGSSNAPALPGSGSSKGYASEGASGGGLVWVQADGTIDLRGTISARGQQGVQSHNAGGSGGGIYLTCRRWTGSGGTLRATGGPGGAENNRGGGGGRIAVWRQTDTYSGSITTNVLGATGVTASGTAGSVVFGWLPAAGTLMLVR